MHNNTSRKPHACICIPTYNAERTIQETLLSLLAQTYRHFTIHIVDNASTDDTLDLVRSFDDSRIIIHTHHENIGAEGNFNRCIDLCLGDFTAIYHADDLYEPTIVEEQVEFLMNHSYAGGVLTEALVIDENARQIGQIKTPAEVCTKDNIYYFEHLFKAVLKHSNFMICPSAMFRTDVLKNTIMYWQATLFATSADLDIWLRLAKHHGLGILPKPLMRYRLSSYHGSAYVKRSVHRADFFLVMDAYLNEDEDVKQFLTKQDRLNYESLERRNQLMRATNLFMEGDMKGAKMLCGSFLSQSLFRSAIKSRHGKFALCLNGLLHFFILFNLKATGKYVFHTLLRRFVR